jgi:hypothetical protein
MAAISPSPTSPSSFSGSSPPSAAASFASPLRLRRRLRGFFLTSPASSVPSADSALTGDGLSSSSVVGGASAVSVGSKGSEEIWRVSAGNNTATALCAGDSE